MHWLTKTAIVISAIVGSYLFTMIALYPVAVWLNDGREMNGGVAMGMAFAVGPVVAIVSGIIAFVMVRKR